MRLLVLLLAISTVLLACAEEVYLRPDGMNMEQAKREMYDCKRDAMMVPRTPQSVTRGAYGMPVYSDPTLGWGDVAVQERMFRECMESKGFRRVQ